MNEKSMSENDRNELQKRISELPSIESIIDFDDEQAHAGPKSNLKGFSLPSGERFYYMANSESDYW